MADSFVPVTFVADELLTSTKMNLLAANQAGFNDGTALGDGIIVTRHVGANQITSPKIAEAFVRGRKKAANTASAPTGLTLQYGWDYVIGSGISEITKAITFPVAYTEPPVVILVPMAASPVSAGAPADTNSFVTHFSAIKGTQSDDITATGFNAKCFADAPFSNTFNFGFSWIAIGKV